MTEKEIQLRKMTEVEFASYRRGAVIALASAEADAFEESVESCLERADAAFSRLVPNDQLDATDQIACKILHNDIEIGILWYEIRKERRIAYLYDVIIYDKYRRRGYARRLFRYLQDLLVSKGVDAILLNVFSQNKPAIILYESVGFTVRSCALMKKINKAR